MDVGASVGKTTCHASYCVGRTGRVFSFEPLPSAADELRRTIGALQLTNVTVVQSAVAAKPGNQIIFERAHKPASSLYESYNAGFDLVGHHECTVTTLNDFVRSNGLRRLDMIKIDVEGAEFDVLRGASLILASSYVEFPPLLVIEVNAREERAAVLGYTVSEMMEWLHAYGYICAVPRRKKLVTIRDEGELRGTDLDMVRWMPRVRPDLNPDA